MKCMAIDDEPLALDLLSSYIKKIPFLTLIGAYSDPYEAIANIHKEAPELLLLDIQMPDLNGLQFLKALPTAPLVIFTTAFSNYAVEGFNLDAVDYLLKPFDFERFLKAVNKAHGIFSTSHILQPENQDDFIFVKADYQLVKITIKDILFIEGLDSYVKIFTGTKPVISLMSLKALVEKLPSSHFIRVHRSYIVNIAKIESIQKNRIKICDRLIPVSLNYSHDFYRMIDGKR